MPGEDKCASFRETRNSEMQAKQAPRHLLAQRRIAEDHTTASGHLPAPALGPENPCAEAQLQDTAVSDPSAVLGVLAYWISR